MRKCWQPSELKSGLTGWWSSSVSTSPTGRLAHDRREGEGCSPSSYETAGSEVPSIGLTERHYAPWVMARQEQLEADVKRSWERDSLAKGAPEVHGKSNVVWIGNFK